MSNVEIHTEFSHWEKSLYSDPYYLVGNSTSELTTLEQESNLKCRKQEWDIYSELKKKHQTIR